MGLQSSPIRMDHIRLLSVQVPADLQSYKPNSKYSTLTLVLHTRAALSAPLPP
jgi:hypothetical protein